MADVYGLMFNVRCASAIFLAQYCTKSSEHEADLIKQLDEMGSTFQYSLPSESAETHNTAQYLMLFTSLYARKPCYAKIVATVPAGPRLDIGHRTLDIRHLTSYIGYRISGTVQYVRSDIQYPMSNVQYLAERLRYSFNTFGARLYSPSRCILDSESRQLVHRSVCQYPTRPPLPSPLY